ncbi:amidohydrolase family protein [Eisenibacter elegans]|uniref:amidohydrolase family protein n=1 Tax=Eisenibacter elegans TaxID=997 RepID=UPI000689099E|nr:amidohydrolase family protein [Eisenibacter elegans]
MTTKLLALWLLLGGMAVYAQGTFPTNGVGDIRSGYFALTGLTIVVESGNTIQNGTLVIREGRVVSASAGNNVPAGATEIPLPGKYVYPAFVDPYSNYGMPEVKRGGGGWSNPQLDSKTDGPYAWNQALRPETQAQGIFKYNSKAAETLRKAGFGAVLSHHADGIARGTGTLVLLHGERENQMFVLGQATQHFSFDKGSSTQSYPTSLMGSIALLRQTYLDADWYAKNTDKREFNLSLEAWNQQKALPAIFEVSDWQNALRADKIGDEFGVQYLIKGAGDEYQRIAEIKATGASFILPLDFPEAYDVTDPLDAQMITLAQLKHWEMAPANAARLHQAGINFAFTANGMKNPQDFLKNLRKAVQYGLDKNTALKAVTQNPAAFLRVADKVGTLRNGAMANFIITSGDLFEEATNILENWNNGHRMVVLEIPARDIRGQYTLAINGEPNYELNIEGTMEKPSFSIKKVGLDDKITTSGTLNNQLLTISAALNSDGQVRLSGWVDQNTLKGVGEAENGTSLTWLATRKGEHSASSESKTTELPTLGKVNYPFGAYGSETLPQQQTLLIKNVTVWTNEADGVLQNTDVLIKNGKISRVGKDLNDGGAIVIDGTGKHLTPGIIDEHSHIGISQGVNEAGLTSSAEVRIGDVLDSQDIDIYRQLAGGVTSSQLLHGSANVIGGQSALIKLKWGEAPEKLKFPNAPGFIKFALGENVKQANWGDNMRVRYPQTRMGVEQVLNDAFTRALEYEQAKGNKRRDLNLETVLEIVKSQRFITCHSYVQSEINMLMKVAESFKFKVNTFTHILEGYKLADKMKEHGVLGASTFADWWAYKMEVKDAIPYNAALMTQMGVNTAINSDDAEMGRRLNQEAAKAVMYGGLSEEEALKTVTLNPAIMLRVADRVGSIKVGKDADVVLWTDNPLSIYASVNKTIIDGTVYFDADTEPAKQAAMREEKARLIQKMLEAKQGGAPTRKADKSEKIRWHCDDITDHFSGEVFHLDERTH